MTSLRERVEAEFENIERILAELPEKQSYSELATAEAGLGDPEAAQKRLQAIIDLPKLSVTESVRGLARALKSKADFSAQE